MSIKITGQKNELTESEKIYFHGLLKGRYAIGPQLGRTGLQTSVYLMQDEHNQSFVLKIPNDINDLNWTKSQENTIVQCKKILKGYSGDVYIPTVLDIGKGYTVEPFAGIELTTMLYDSLDMQEKQKIVHDFAYLLYYLHANNPVGISSPLGMFNKPTLNEVFDYMQSTFDFEQKHYIMDIIKHFNERDTADEVTVMTHADIRSQNVLYCKEQKRLAVIDFELAKQRNIYHDFVPTAAASFCLPYDMLFEIVCQYNQMAEPSNIAVNLDKIKLLHQLGIFHEYGRCAIFRDTKGDDLMAVNKIIFDCMRGVHTQ